MTSLSIEDLFPPCQAVSCPQRWQHKHPLASQLELIHSQEKYVCQLGGYGSAKTLAGNILCVLLMLSVPGNLGIIVRRTYPKLHDSTLKIFQEVVEQAQIEGVRFRENRDGFSHRITFPNESEVVFRPSKDLGRFLGPEYGFFMIDEAKEEPEKTFTDLQGRLRLPRAAQHLRGILLSNPPHDRHWIAKYFGKQPGTVAQRTVVQGTEVETLYRLMRVSTRDNPHVPPEYIADLLKRSPSEVAAIVEGFYSFTPDGPPVFPQFQHGRHVGAPEAIMTLPLLRSWDFGARHPAVTWHQARRCAQRALHWAILDEYDAQHIESESLADQVGRRTREMFPTFPPSLLLDCGDRMGAATSEKGPGPIIRLRESHGLNFRYAYREILPGLFAIRHLLNNTCACGQPLLVIHRRCQNVIAAMSGGYHLPDGKVGDAAELPVKDGFYDDFMDSVRYAYENFIRYEQADAGFLEQEAERPREAPDSMGMAWMDPEPTEAQVAAEIARVLGRPLLPESGAQA